MSRIGRRKVDGRQKAAGGEIGSGAEAAAMVDCRSFKLARSALEHGKLKYFAKFNNMNK